MRSEQEIQRAHDILVAIIVGDVPNPFNPGHKFKAESTQERICAETCSALCWILEHGHNPTFGKNLEAIEKEIGDMGFNLEFMGN